MEFLYALQGKVTRKINQDLIKTFTAAEVAEALHQMNPTKASGPDGMAPIFYHRYWHIVGDSITITVLQLPLLYCKLLMETHANGRQSII